MITPISIYAVIITLLFISLLVLFVFAVFFHARVVADFQDRINDIENKYK
jgi:NADH:ubiquinone oxidoreductase subunit H